jgi:hypothetical protein
MLLIPLAFVPSRLEAHDALDPRLVEVCILTCEALLSYAVGVAGRSSLN